MNKYDELYEYRLATVEDTDNIMDFIRREWNPNHIFAHDKEFFLWQYGRTEYGDEKNLNFVLTLSKETGKILGGIGYVAYSNNPDKLDISPAISKVKSHGLLPMSGLEQMKRQMQLVGERSQLSSGTNPVTMRPLYDRVFHYRTGVMQQFYIANPNCENFKIAKFPQGNPRKKGLYNPRYHLHEISSIDELGGFDFEHDYDDMSYKSYEFIQKRYFNHPIYSYRVWKIIDADDKIRGFIIGRVIEINQSKALRLVDYRGELPILYDTIGVVTDILIKENIEYADIMADRLDIEKMRAAGFELLDIHGDIMVPNYFEPYVAENIEVNYENNTDRILFKADGDQDRPNHR